MEKEQMSKPEPANAVKFPENFIYLIHMYSTGTYSSGQKSGNFSNFFFIAVFLNFGTNLSRFWYHFLVQKILFKKVETDFYVAKIL
jgi:hypothetical protein